MSETERPWTDEFVEDFVRRQYEAEALGGNWEQLTEGYREAVRKSIRVDLDALAPYVVGLVQAAEAERDEARAALDRVLLQAEARWRAREGEGAALIADAFKLEADWVRATRGPRAD